MRRRLLVVAAVVAAIVAVGVLTAPPGPKPPLDPTSTAPDGTRALVLTLRSLGATVHLGAAVPDQPGGTALLLDDQLSRGDRAKLGGWVEGGGTLVVADPASPLAGVGPDPSEGDRITPPRARGAWPGCDLAAVAGVRRLPRALDGAELLAADIPGTTACFPAGHGALLVARPEGRGVVVVLGGPTAFTNAELGAGDDAVLAAGLLLPMPSATVTVVAPSEVGGAGAGGQGLVDLLSPHVVEGAVGACMAFVVLVVARARRLGRPVAEVVPVELPGSGLVEATGRLLHDGGHRATATVALRAELRRRLVEALGTGQAASAPDLAAVAADRTGLDAATLAAALEGPPAADDASLLALAHLIAATDEELRRVP